MAKRYGFDEQGRDEYRKIRKTVLGGRNRTHVFKKWDRGTGGGGEFIITGLATAAVTSGDATFTIDGLANVTAGTLPSEPLTVNNTLALTLGDNQKVYAILNVDGEWDTWADTGEGTTTDPSAFIFADFTATATSDRATDTITADIDDYWGSTPAATTSVTVHKLSDHDVTIYSGDKFRGIWDTTAEEWKLFWFSGLRITVQGTVSNGGSDVTPSTSTFSLTSPALVNGWRLPAATITVTNNPPLYVAAGTTIKARFNITLGTNPLTSWDTGDAGNILYMLKGIGGYNAGGTTQYVRNEVGGDDPEWAEFDSGIPGLAVIVGTVPASTGFADYVDMSTAMITPGVLTHTSTDGAWLVDPSTGLPLSSTPLDVVNPSATSFVSGDPPTAVIGVVKSGNFIIATSEIRTRPGYDETKGNLVMVQPGDSGVEMVVTGWSSNDKSLGSDTTGDAEWQDDGEC